MFRYTQKAMNLRIATSVLILAATLTSASADAVVRAAQARLQELGYFDFTIDGEWGPRTSASVERYQAAKALEVTGTLTRQTLKNLKIRVQSKPAATPVPLYKAIPDLFVGGPFLSSPTAFQVRVIESAQENLQTLGFYSGPVDGNPSGSLRNAIKEYQRSSRFKATGRLDKTTLQGLGLLYLR